MRTTVGLDNRNVNSVSSELEPELHLHFLPRGHFHVRHYRPALASAGTSSRGAIRRGARRVDRQRRAPLDRRVAQLLPGRPVVGHQRLHAHVRRLPAARRADGGPARPSPDVHRRPDRVRRRFTRGRARAERCMADRRPCRPGPRRRAALPGRAVARDHAVRRRRRAQQGDGRVGRGRRLRRRRRRPARRHAHRVGRLGVGAVRQRADRHRRRAALPAAAARVARRRRPPLRRRRRGHGDARPVAARLLARQRQRGRLGLGRDADPARGRRGADRRVRRDRAAQRRRRWSRSRASSATAASPASTSPRC